jgi:hypothetical protein
LGSTVATRLGIFVVAFPALKGRAKLNRRYAAEKLHLILSKTITGLSSYFQFSVFSFQLRSFDQQLKTENWFFI